MSLNIPLSLGPTIVAGPVSSATGIIIDFSTIRVRFTQTQYTGSEATGFVMVTNGVGSCTVLGGTVHYQDTISMEKIIFLWSDTKNWGAPAPLPPWFLHL